MRKNDDMRVLINAPVGQDASAMASLLEENGFHAAVCDGAMEICFLISEGAGALLMTEEALESPQITNLFERLKNQPPWLEIPLIVLTSGGESRLAKLLNLASNAAGSMTLLERPIGSATLLRSIEVALRSRKRQYEMRDLLWVKARLAAIVESSGDAIISKNLDGVIMTWNDAARRLFGYTAEEAVGKSITMLIPADRLEEEAAILGRIRRGETIEHYETIRRRKDGALLDISLTVSPIIGADGKVAGASKIARDISERRRTERALAAAQEELARRAADLETTVAERTADLRAINEQLDSFVYSIAHDLRSPLRSITSFSQLLREDHAAQLEETGLHHLQRIQAASEFMDKLLLDLLAYGRTARAELELKPVSLAKAWEMAVFQSASQIESTHPKIEAGKLGLFVVAHEATLTQCLANLLNNAIKFVAPGVRPRVRCWAQQRGNLVRVWIEDNGIGIPPSQHERVFRVFERLNGERYGGTGIGLSIVRKGIERMGGRMGLKSEAGKGSKFWIELPCAKFDENEKRSTAQRVKKPRPTATRLVRF